MLLRALLFVLAVFFLAAPAHASSTYWNLPPAQQPVGTVPDAVPLDQGTGCPSQGTPCYTAQTPSLRLGQPLVQNCSLIVSPFQYQQCFDTTTSPATLKVYVGTSWQPAVNFSGGGNVLIPTVANNAALQALTAGQYPFVIRQGFSTPGDAPTLPFVWMATCPGAPDNLGYLVAPLTGGTGCWVADYTGAIDIREFGAVGNGSTPSSAGTQAALNAAAAMGGGNVWVPPAGDAFVWQTGLQIPAGVHLKGAGGLNWSSPIDNTRTHWTNKSSWGWCQDTTNPCITYEGNSSSVEGINFWYTQPTPTAGACGTPCTYVTYTPTVYPYTILVSPTATVGNWIIDDSIVNASHCVDWEGPSSGVAGIYSGMDRDSFGCFDVGTRFHMIDNTLTLSRLRYEMWWYQGNAQWWYAMQGASHVDWDIEYLANPQITDVEFSFGGVAMKFTDACVSSGFGNICFAVTGMQAKGVSFNENCMAMTVAAATTHVTGVFDAPIAYSDSTSSPVSGQCARATPYFFNLASDNANVTLDNLQGGFVQSLAFIGGGNSGPVHGQLHLKNPAVQQYSSYANGAPAIAVDTTGSILDMSGGTPQLYPSSTNTAGAVCSSGGVSGANGCQSTANTFYGNLEIGGATAGARELFFSQVGTPAMPPAFEQGVAQWGLRADGGGNFYLDRFNPSTGAFIDAPWFIVPVSTATNNTQLQITGETVTHGGIYMVPILISALPACGPSNAGMIETVSNGANSPTYGATVSATGSSAALVMCNNTNWIYQ